VQHKAARCPRLLPITTLTNNRIRIWYTLRIGAALSLPHS
jgi:hypothetical protein